MSSPAYVVLGATGGIGHSLCERLSKQGASLLLGGRDEERLAGLAEQTGGTSLAGDARDPEVVEQTVTRAVEKFGRLDGAVNLVGSMLLKPAHRTTPEEVQDLLATHIVSSFNLIRAAAPAMREGPGSIVLMSSAAARTGMANHDAIAAAKAGVEGLARSAAASYASQGLRVNCVAPGLVRTPLTERLTSSETSLAASEAMHPLGRIGEPEEIAAAIAWLLDADNGWVTGQVLAVDGGIANVRGRVKI